jgi:DNA-binding response OmpR family regulator
MSAQPDTILIVDDDPETRALLRDQVFSAKNFRVFEAKDGPDALLRLGEHHPDLIVLDLQLPGLSGHDTLVALKAQGFIGPMVAIAEETNRRPVVDAFRLGATDYLTRPIREAEVLAAAERGLSAVRLRRQRDGLIAQLQQANHQLEARVKELTTLQVIGQSVAALTDLESVLNRVLEGAISLTGADQSVLFLRDDKSDQLVLRAGKNLPLAMLDRMGDPVQDKLADLVMTSREALVVAGDSLRRFALAKDLYSVAYVPLTVQKLAVGVLAVGNHKTQTPFTDNHGRLLKALADYTVIAIVSARLSHLLGQRSSAMETAARELRERDARRDKQLQEILTHLHQPLVAIESELIRLAQDPVSPKDAGHKLAALAHQVRQLVTAVNALEQRRDH